MTTPPAFTEKANQPEDLTRLFVERANNGDAAGIAELYEEEAVMAYPRASRRWAATPSGRCGRACWPTPPTSNRSRRCLR
jgi:hypothetical protein